MMKKTKGRISSLSFLFNSYKKDVIEINLLNERIVFFEDGTMRRFHKDIRVRDTVARGLR